MSLDEFIPGWNPGTDGEAVLDGETPNVFSTLDAGTRTYALSRSVFFTKLTVKAGVTIRLNGFSLFVSKCNGPHFESLFRVVSNKGVRRQRAWRKPGEAVVQLEDGFYLLAKRKEPIPER